MSFDLEARLRSIHEILPEPGQKATDSARRAMHEANATAPWVNRRRRSWFSRGPRPYLLAAAAALLIAGAAIAATHWSVKDLPPFGDGDSDAFVLPTTDVLPGGYERTRPPLYKELPARPSLLFPAGVTYTQAVARYIAARNKGQVLPPGVVLADPLPAGKVILVDKGRVSLDPAAPLGYSATTGLVNSPPSFRPVIARCQLLLGANDPDSPACDAPRERNYVREGVAGRWIASENPEGVTDPLLPASTAFSLLDHPAGHPYPLTAGEVPQFPPGAQEVLVGKARLAQRRDGVALVAVPLSGRGLCLAAIGPIGGTWQCGPRASMFRRGAVLLNLRAAGGPLRVSGFVGDGITRVTADDGTTAQVVNNSFTMVPGESVRRFTFSGPVGSFTIVQPGRAHGAPQAPDRSKERELVGIDLAGGGRASVLVAPNRAGGRCVRTFIKNVLRSSGCSGPRAKIPFDVVTGGFPAGGAGYPFVYSGEFSPEVGTVQMDFADGTSERLPLTEGFVLYEVPPDRIASRGRWPVSVTTFDQKGVALVREPLGVFPSLVRQQRPHP